MRPFAGFLILVVALVGCRAPGSPNGATAGRTVPPPGTGSFGAPDAYYNRRPATGAPTTPGTAPRTGTSLGFNDSTVDTLDGGWHSASNGQLPGLSERAAPASYDTAVGAGLPANNRGFQSPTLPTTNSQNAAGASSAARGMRVNDGTGFAEPKRFTAAAAHEIGRTLAPPDVDFSASQAGDDASGNTSSGQSSGLSFRPPSIRRSTVETPTNNTYIR